MTELEQAIADYAEHLEDCPESHDVPAELRKILADLSAGTA